MLEWTGMATILELTRFIRTLRLLCAKVSDHVFSCIPASGAHFLCSKKLHYSFGIISRTLKNQMNSSEHCNNCAPIISMSDHLSLARVVPSVGRYVCTQSITSNSHTELGRKVALHQGPSTRSSKGVKLMTRSKAIQYRLSDFSAVYFARGNSSSIL